MTVTGIIEKGHIAAHSKSERDAVMIKTRKGRYILRRQQGNPFVDPVLEGLVGKRVRCRGNVAGGTFLMSTCDVLESM